MTRLFSTEFKWTQRELRFGQVGLACLAVASALAGCGGSVVEGPSTRADYGCIDDSQQCINQRQAALKSLQADQTRSWVRQPASISSYATGVRLYAFKLEKPKLNCSELAAGRDEANGAPGTLRSPAARGLTPAQVSRGLMFAEEVGKELTRESQRRCK